MIVSLKKTPCIPLAIAAMMLANTTVAVAQWDPYPWKRVPRKADGKVDLNAPAQRTPYGKPDLSGFWMPENPVKYLLDLAADMRPEDVPRSGLLSFNVACFWCRGVEFHSHETNVVLKVGSV